jgi:hypothetical protein
MNKDVPAGEVCQIFTIMDLSPTNQVRKIPVPGDRNQGGKKGVYQIDSGTGMLIKSRMENEIKGTIEMIGRIIPIALDNTITVTRQ